MAKDYVIVKGRLIKMNDAAFKIASKRFGATKNRPEEKVVPIELLRMPKLKIQPRIQPEVKVVEAVKEPVIEQTPVEPLSKEEPVKKEPVKSTRGRR